MPGQQGGVVADPAIVPVACAYLAGSFAAEVESDAGCGHGDTEMPCGLLQQSVRALSRKLLQFCWRQLMNLLRHGVWFGLLASFLIRGYYLSDQETADLIMDPEHH